MKESFKKVKHFLYIKFHIAKDEIIRIIQKLSPKPNKKPTKSQQRLIREQQRRAILGIGLLLVVVSIAYSTAVIYIGVDSTESRIALIPQVVFAFATLIRAFLKLYK